MRITLDVTTLLSSKKTWLIASAAALLGYAYWTWTQRKENTTIEKNEAAKPVEAAIAPKPNTANLFKPTSKPTSPTQGSQPQTSLGPEEPIETTRATFCSTQQQKHSVVPAAPNTDPSLIDVSGDYIRVPDPKEEVTSHAHFGEDNQEARTEHAFRLGGH